MIHSGAPREHRYCVRQCGTGSRAADGPTKRSQSKKREGGEDFVKRVRRGERDTLTACVLWETETEKDRS